jgi:hypothetical protein
MTEADLRALLKRMNWKCFICGVRLRGRKHVDHAHTNRGHVRALTHPNCNVVEGLLRRYRTLDALIRIAYGIVALRRITS